MDKERYIKAEQELSRRIREAQSNATGCKPPPRAKFYLSQIEVYQKVLNALGTESNFMFLRMMEGEARDALGKRWKFEKEHVETMYSSDGTLYAIKICRRLLKGLVESE